jgi:hypothetical protein
MSSHIMRVLGVMTLRRKSDKGNANGHPDPGRSTDERDPLLTLRAAFILMAAAIAATVAGMLTFLMNGSAPGAALAAGSAFATIIVLLNGIVGR